MGWRPRHFPFGKRLNDQIEAKIGAHTKRPGYFPDLAGRRASNPSMNKSADMISNRPNGVSNRYL